MIRNAKITAALVATGVLVSLGYTAVAQQSQNPPVQAPQPAVAPTSSPVPLPINPDGTQPTNQTPQIQAPQSAPLQTSPGGTQPTYQNPPVQAPQSAPLQTSPGGTQPTYQNPPIQAPQSAPLQTSPGGTQPTYQTPSQQTIPSTQQYPNPTQQTTPSPTQPRNRSTTPSSQATLSTIDRQFAIAAAQGGMAEVRLGQLAVARAVSPSVKQYAQRMVQEHTQVNNQLMQLAAQKGITLPKDVNAQQKALRAKLGQIPGKRFDQLYIQEAGVKAHNQQAALFQREAQQGQDPDMKAFAANILPAVKDHLQMARSMTTGGTAAMTK